MDEDREARQNGDGTAALRLASRLLFSHFPYSSSDEHPRLFIGRLPEEMPFDVPVPDGFTLVGSVLLKASRGRPVVETVLDTDLSAVRAREVYRRLLIDDGWREDHQMAEPGGFARGPRGFLMSLSRLLPRRSGRPSADARGLWAVFDRRRQTLFVSADERKGEPADVRLRLISGHDMPRFLDRGDPEAWRVIPLLTPPPCSFRSGDREGFGVLAPPFDARKSGGNPDGSGWGPDGAYSYAAIETDLDLDAVARHYAAQLADAGWTCTDGGTGGPQAWSAWTFDDSAGKPWVAAFTALRLPETPRRVFLHLRADLKRAENE